MTTNHSPLPLYDASSPDFLAHVSPAMRRAVLEELAVSKPFSEQDEQWPLHLPCDMEPLVYPPEVYRALDSFMRSAAWWALDAAAKNPLLLTLEGGEPSQEPVLQLQRLTGGISLWLFDEAGWALTLASVERLNRECREWAGQHHSRRGVAICLNNLVRLVREVHETRSTGNEPDSPASTADNMLESEAAPSST
jgi:hypothetical protein